MQTLKIDFNVGQSSRTLGKHALLNKIVGREIAIVKGNYCKFLSDNYVALDLCAGNGKHAFFSGMSSPQIISKHICQYPKGYVFFYEKDANTFSELKKIFPLTSYFQDASEIKELPIDVSENTSVFIHCDPNLISDWALSKELLKNSTKFTTSLITLGCNVGGLKRLSLDKRQEWFSKIDDVLSFLPNWHDALLVALSGDKAQWAYLITGSRKWHDKGIYASDAKKSFSYWQHGLELVQYRKNQTQFFDLINRLFLTKKEYADAS